MGVISILGCGWLGFSLAKELIKSGYEVKGSTTSSQKLSILETNKIYPFQIQLNPELYGDNLNLFFDCDYLIINIPPPRRENVIEYHLKQIQSVIEELKKSRCNKIIFVSSTSVYGNTNSQVNENSPADPDSSSGKALLQVERYLRELKNFNITIIRFGGFIGEDRNPVEYFSGRKNIPGGKTPVNLIHQKDCIGIITAVISKEIWNETINGVSPNHPARKEFYTKAAVNLNLELPDFDDSIEPYKIVSSFKLRELLNYKFIYPDPLKMF